MSLQKIQEWSFSTKINSKFFDNLTLWLFFLSFFSVTTFKTLASEEVIITQELDYLDEPNQMSQVTNVEQLRDVSPTDWAYEALRSLVERYSDALPDAPDGDAGSHPCLAGFPNQTYRGDRALSRYEFAAGLNSCLNQIEGLIASSETIVEEDLDTIRRLNREFATELATIAGRIDNLEGRTAFLEDNQFSTTTKLTGNVFLNLTGTTAGDNVLVETNNLDTALNLRRAGRDSNNKPIINEVTDDPEITLSYYTWLNFNSSFTGRDNLTIQLVAGNGDSPANSFASAGLYNTFGVPFTDQTGTVNGANNVEIRELFYEFPIGEKLQVVVGSRINWYRYFDNNAYTFFLTGAGSYNSSGGTLVNPVDRGSGAVITFDLNDFVTFKVGYLGENTEFLPAAFFNTSSDPDKGLFSGTQSITAEVDFSIAERANIRLLYTRSTVDNNVPIFDEDGNLTGFGIGGATGEPVYGVADDGFGGTIGDAPADTFAVNFDWQILDWLGIFGRYSYGSTSIFPRDDDRDEGEIEAQAIQAGLAFPDIGKEGALGTFSFVIPFDILDGEEFLASGAGDGGTQYEFELTYFFPVNDNLALVPAFYLVANPNNFEDNPNIYVGNLRMQFRF